MSAWSAPSATIEACRRGAGALALALLLCPALAAAQAPSGPPQVRFATAFDGVTRLILREAELTRSSDYGCPVDALSFNAYLRQEVQRIGVKVELASSGALADAASVYISPSVYVYSRDGLCVAWLQLRAETTEALRLPDARNREKALRVIFWEGTRMIVSDTGTIYREIGEQFVALAQDLGVAVRQGQDGQVPPPR